MNTVYWAAADLLILAVELPLLPALPEPGELRQRILTGLDAMVGKGRGFGLSDADLAEARYAFVAFIDEQILKSNWPGKNEWMSQPLQLVLYREYTAGENFFARLRSLLQQGNRPGALEAYYLCLALGFRGAYGVSGDMSALGSFQEAARQQLARVLPNASRIGPNAQPRDRASAGKSSNAALIGLVAGCVLIVLMMVIGLQWSLKKKVGDSVAAMPAASAG